MQNALGPIEAKTALDFCTEADHAVENLIRREVAERFGDGFIGEEDGGEPGRAVWVVDPIDGTACYIHRDPRWCVSIGLVVDGVVELGVIYAPATDQLFTARRGRGARLNGRLIHVSNLGHGAAPVVECGCSERRPIEAYATALQRLRAAGIEFRRHGSGALGLADVALGVSDGYLELHINAWDVMAGLVLVTEAGGYVNDFLEGDGLRRGNMIVAATPEIAERLTQIVSDLVTR
jgi:myo-inositol-1(or 4)-monophosphatase